MRVPIKVIARRRRHPTRGTHSRDEAGRSVSGVNVDGWLVEGGRGLATGLAGVLAGMLMLRAVRFLFGLGRGIEGMGVGDADLMMMAGAFLGCQPILVAFFVSVFPALLLGIVQLIVRGNKPMPFGPSLALGVLLTLYGWRWLGNRSGGNAHR